MTRLAAIILLTAVLVLPLASCGSMPDFDPTDLIPNDLFGSKKKLQGERKPVFPEGVPGVAQGIPPDLIKGNQPAPDAGLAGEPQGDAAAAAATPVTPATRQAATTPEEYTPAPREKAKPKPKPKPKQAKVERAPTSVTVGPSQEQQPQQQPPAQQSGVQWPEPPAPTRSSPASGVQWPDPPPMH
jgi:hypothetical protein